MFIAKNLRKLRLEKGFTQEELAAFFGISGQAVGKWERDECFPDITLLPGLAKLFGVTIDELMGTEEIHMNEKINETQKKKFELASLHEYAEIVLLLEEEGKNDPRVFMEDLAVALALSGDKSERPLRMLEQALEDKTRSYKSLGTVYAELCFLYKSHNMMEMAEKQARSLPHARESREFLLPHFLGKKKREEYLRENIPEILSAICALIDGESMTDDEQLHSIQYGKHQKPMSPSEVVQKIAEFLK